MFCFWLDLLFFSKSQNWFWSTEIPSKRYSYNLVSDCNLLHLYCCILKSIELFELLLLFFQMMRGLVHYISSLTWTWQSNQSIIMFRSVFHVLLYWKKRREGKWRIGIFQKNPIKIQFVLVGNFRIFVALNLSLLIYFAFFIISLLYFILFFFSTKMCIHFTDSDRQGKQSKVGGFLFLF